MSNTPYLDKAREEFDNFHEYNYMGNPTFLIVSEDIISFMVKEIISENLDVDRPQSFCIDIDDTNYMKIFGLEVLIVRNRNDFIRIV